MFILQSLVEALFITVLLLLFLVIIGAFLYLKFKPKKQKTPKEPELSQTTRVIVALSHLIEDKDKPASLSIGADESPLCLSEVKEGLTQLLDYPEITEVILDIDATQLSAVHIEELQPFFHALKKQKQVTAFASSYDLSDYQAALLADKITLLQSRQASLSLLAPSYQEPYLQSFFHRLGVRFHVLHLGDYKLAGENMNHDAMSPQKDAVVMKTLTQRLEAADRRIQQHRGLPSVKEHLIAGDYAYLNGAAALDYGLIDDERTYTEMDLEDVTHTLSFASFLKKAHNETKKKKKKSKQSTPSIALLTLEGEIGSRQGITTQRKRITAEAVIEKLQLIDKEATKALVLRIDSPGGSALESERIYQALKKLDIPIYVSMGSYAASGGYELACVGQKIFANTQTLTGSIGVVAMIPEVAGAIEKLDVTIEERHLGRYHDLTNRLLPLSEDSKQLLLKSMEECYTEFKEHVLDARPLTPEALEAIAQGKVWTGTEAVDNGLVDAIGTLEDCIQSVVADLHLDNDDVTPLTLQHNITDRFKKLMPLLQLSPSQSLQQALAPKTEILYQELSMMEL